MIVFYPTPSTSKREWLMLYWLIDWLIDWYLGTWYVFPIYYYNYLEYQSITGKQVSPTRISIEFNSLLLSYLRISSQFFWSRFVKVDQQHLILCSWSGGHLMCTSVLRLLHRRKFFYVAASAPTGTVWGLGIGEW